MPRLSKSHCAHGHEFTPENTMISRGHRYCRTCRRANSRRYDARPVASDDPVFVALGALWTGDNDLTTEDIAARFGWSVATCRKYASRCRLHRHPETIRRRQMAIGADLARQADEQQRTEALRAAAWPPHRFEDDPYQHALSVWRRGKGLQVFAPLRVALNQTLAGVASGWGNGAALGLSRTGARAGAA